MKKLICIAAILLGGMISANSQEAFDHTFEIGVGGAEFHPTFLSLSDYSWRSPGLTFYAEYRFGITNWFAVGAQLDFKTSGGFDFTSLRDVYDQLRYFQEALKLVAEVKFCPKKTIKPFVGVTFGTGFGQSMRSVDGFLNSLMYCDLGPRVGLQLGKHIRAAVQFSFSPSVDDDGIFRIVNGNYSSMGVNFGWAF